MCWKEQDSARARHGNVRSDRTVRTLRERLKRPLNRFGDVPLADLEPMTDDVADFTAGLAERWRHPVVLAFRQTLHAGIRYGYLTANPAKLAGPNPESPPRAVRVYTVSVSVDQLVVRPSACQCPGPGCRARGW
jgi:hypothetical protein